MLPILQVGPLAIQTPGLIWLLGLWFGLQLAERNAARAGVKPDQVDRLVLWSLIGGIVGARVGFLLRFPDSWLQQPLSFFSLSPGMLDPGAGLLFAGLVMLILGSRSLLSFWNTLDALSPLLAVLVIAHNLAQLAAGTGFGTPTNVPWGLDLWGSTRHPTQVYAVLLAAGFLLLILRLSRMPGVYGSGSAFATWLSASAISVIFLEAFRGDSVVWLGSLRVAQIAAFFLLAAGLWVFGRRLPAVDQSIAPSTVGGQEQE